MDPQLKCFVDESGIEIPDDWGLPVPNAAASYKSLAKYGKDLLPMTNEMVGDMNKAWEWTSRHFGVYMGDSRVLGYEEAKEHLDMSTSSGAPFNIHYKDKRELFEKDPNIDTWLQADWETMALDPLWTCLFTNSLKEELRTEVKMQENSIRTFLSGGVDAVMHGTRLFVDMNEKMYASHIKSASAVGMSPYKGNWDQLYHKLNVFSKGYALDESQYDSSLRVFLMWGCARMRWNMLAGEDQTIENFQRIKIYYRNLVNTLIVCPDGVLVLKKTGNPSGSVNTITDNTLILYTLLAYAWIRKSKGTEFHTYVEFELNTAKALVGDDNTWTVSDEAHEFYNAVTVIEEWRHLGVTTTTDSLEPRKAAELDFLSAHTIFLNGKAVPVYDRTKLMTSLLYAPSKHITPATTLERTAAMLSVGWTDIPFRRFCREVIAWLLYKYDEVLADEPHWMMAKCQIQTDDVYRRLFTGESTRLHLQNVVELFPQGANLSGDIVKLLQPDKSPMNGAKPKRTGRKPGKKTQRKGTVAGKKKGPATQRRRAKRQGLVASGQGSYHLTGDTAWDFPNLGIKGSIRGGYASDSVATGSGAYSVKSNSLLNAIDMTGTVPRVRNLTNGEAFVVSHKEYIKDIISSTFEPDTESTVFKLETFALNPSNVLLFPWLSNIAGNFQEYRITGMLVEFKTTCSDLSTTLSLGAVMMTADYNVLAPPPINKQLLENMENAGSCKPSCSLIMPIECKTNLTAVSHLYVGPLAAEIGDLRLYDMCNIFFASFGIPKEEVTIGELWVTYEIAFYKPKLLPYPVEQSNLSWACTWATASEGSPLPVDMGIIAPHSSPLFSLVPDAINPFVVNVHFPQAIGQIFIVTISWTDVSGLGITAQTVPTNLTAGLEYVDFPETSFTTMTAPEFGSNPTNDSTNMLTRFIVRVIEVGGVDHPLLGLDQGTGRFNESFVGMTISAWNSRFGSPEAVFTAIQPTMEALPQGLGNFKDPKLRRVIVEKQEPMRDETRTRSLTRKPTR